MRRRTLLTAAALPFVAGCPVTGDGNGEGPPATSTGNDDEPITASPDALLLERTDLDGDDWEEREADDEHCRAFGRLEQQEDTTVTSCAWVHDDVDTAQSEYETEVERTWKQANNKADDPPVVGAETARVDGYGQSNVIFRDANAVGKLSVVATNEGIGPVHGEVDPENAERWAILMHQHWRD